MFSWRILNRVLVTYREFNRNSLQMLPTIFTGCIVSVVALVTVVTFIDSAVLFESECGWKGSHNEDDRNLKHS